MKKDNNTNWVWVFVKEGKEKDNFLGQYSEKLNTSFIPCFNSKEDALKCYNLLVKENNVKYDVQAIDRNFLKELLNKKDFTILVLDETGKIIS